MIRFEKDGKSEYWYDAADLAKFLNIRHPDTKRIIGRNQFLDLLRFNNIVMVDSNQPSQYWVNLGLAKWHMVKRKYKRYGMPIFSEKAFGYIENRIADGRLQIGFKKRVVKPVVKLTVNDVC